VLAALDLSAVFLRAMFATNDLRTLNVSSPRTGSYVFGASNKEI